MYYRNANAAIIVYDISNYQSFEKAQKWVNELLEKANPGILMALCGNKSDLEENRKVNYDEAKRYSDSIGSFFIEVSALTSDNIENLFEEIAMRLPKEVIKKEGINFEQPNEVDNTRRCNC
jgi:Ras-related protein Rab-5C